MIFDTHTHYNLPPFVDDWRTHWETAKAAGVTEAVIIGVDLATSTRAVEIASEADGLYASVGIHPSDAIAWNDSVAQQLRALAAHPKVVAIGETGMDLARVSPEEKSKSSLKQEEAFRAQLQLAEELKKTLIVHARDAYEEVLTVLRSEKLPTAIVLHCMSGTLEYQQEALKLGCYCSFAGNVTYPSAESLRELAKQTPSDRLLLETDAPFLPPQSKRGKPNEPAFIIETAGFLSSLLGSTMEQLSMQTTKNARTCFQIQ